jgi:hypothetical protein
MIDAGFTIAAAKLRSGIVLVHTFDPDPERRAGLAAIGRKAVPVIPNELTRTCHCGLLFVSASPANRAPRCSLSCSSPTSGAVRRSPHKRVTCASGRRRTASESGQRTLNPRVRGSSPWRRTRPDLVLYLFWLHSRGPFRAGGCSTFARLS